MILYTIYKNPLDYPGKFVVRRWLVGPSVIHSKELVAVVDSLEDARKAIPEGLIVTPRDADDDRVIVETWV